MWVDATSIIQIISYYLMCFCWSNLELRTLSALSFSFPFLVVIIHNTHTPCSLSSCQLLQPVASLNMLLSFSLSIALSKWQHVYSLPTPPQKVVPRSAWQLKALHSQHSSKLVRVLFAFRLLRCVLSAVCVCVCFFVCVWGHGRFADTNLPSTLYVLFVSHLLHATHRQRQRRAASHALLPSTAAQPGVAVTMPIMQYKLRLIVNAKLLSSRRQLVLAQTGNASYAQCNKTCNKLLNLISSTQRERERESCHGNKKALQACSP